MRKIKKQISKTIDIYVLLKNNWKNYYSFFKYFRREIKPELKKRNISRIRIYAFSDWKVSYDCGYFCGIQKLENGLRKKIFIKVLGEELYDCYQNEVLLNRYIDDNSLFLKAHKPALYHAFTIGKQYVLVSELFKMQAVESVDAIEEDIAKAVDEYSRIGILHTDFGLVNMGMYHENCIFFDYGTSLCKDSDEIRVRNGKSYNHISDIIPKASELIKDPDFYYDDIIHAGVKNMNRENVNFIVGKDDIYYSKLGDTVTKYRTHLLYPGCPVLILQKI